MSDTNKTNNTKTYNTDGVETRSANNSGLIHKSWDGGKNSAEPNGTTNKGPLDD